MSCTGLTLNFITGTTISFYATVEKIPDQVKLSIIDNEGNPIVTDEIMTAFALLTYVAYIDTTGWTNQTYHAIVDVYSGIYKTRYSEPFNVLDIVRI